jgi:Protein of unknown function (DUF3297)
MRGETGEQEARGLIGFAFNIGSNYTSPLRWSPNLSYTDAMTDAPETTALPDRLCVNPRSAYYNEEILLQGIGVRFKGEEKTNVEEYCISEGWVKLALGNKVDRKGNPLTITQKGVVEVWIKGDA